MRILRSLATATCLLVALSCGGGGGGGSAPPAVTGSALIFSGDDFVHVPSAFNFSDALTLEAWVKPTSLTQEGTWPGIVAGIPAFGLHLIAAVPGRFRGTVCLPSCDAAESGTGAVTVGEWQHVAMVYVGGFIALYRNGQLLAQIWHPGDVSPTAQLHIGKFLDHHFVGLIDEVRVWDVSRSGPEIDADKGKVLAGNEPGLIGYWRFEEGSGQTVGDSAAGGTAGTLGATAASGSDDPTWVAEGAPVSP